jgi:hypothetical protein
MVYCGYLGVKYSEHCRRLLLLSVQNIPLKNELPFSIFTLFSELVTVSLFSTFVLLHLIRSLNCGAGWKCASLAQCLPAQLRCDGVPQCPDW